MALQATLRRLQSSSPMPAAQVGATKCSSSDGGEVDAADDAFVVEDQVLERLVVR